MPLKKLIIVLLLILVFPINTQAFNGISCDNLFEVSYITDDGNFNKISCYNTLEEAKAKMRENENYVVRHRSSDSPTDIVAINHGIAYIYAHRYSDKITMNIWDKPYNKEYVSTYSDSYREVLYIDTVEFDTSNGEGTTTVLLNGFKGGIGLEYIDLVPNKFIKNGLPISIGGGYRESAITIIPQRSYYDVKQDGNYRDLVYHYYPAYNKSGSQYQPHYSYAIGLAPKEFKDNTKYYSSDGVNFYLDLEEKNFSHQHYNYYQFLPLRSKSKIKESSYNKFLEYFDISKDSKLYDTGNYFINAQNEYGVNSASVFGIAVNESGFGMSFFARNRNNLFGLNAIDSDPSKATRYNSVEDAINTMTSYYVQSYIDIADWRFFGSSLGNKGSGLNVKYASDPHWSIKASKYYYYLDKVDNDFNGNLTDYNQVKLALVKNINTKFYKEPNGEIIFISYYNKEYQKDFIVNVLETNNDWTKVQFTNPITDGKVLKWKDIDYKTKYNWSTSIAYIKTEDLLFLNTLGATNGDIAINKKEIIFAEPIIKFIGTHHTDKVSFNNQVLSISGTAFIDGYDLFDKERIKHSILIENLITGNKSIEQAETYQVDDGRYIGFKANIDFKDYNYGEFSISIIIDQDNEQRIFHLSQKDDNQLYDTELLLKREQNNAYKIKVIKSKFIEKINKKDFRDTFVRLQDFINIDNGISLKGTGIMFGLDLTTVEYSLILENKDNKYIYPINNKKQDYDLSKILKSEVDINNSIFYIDNLMIPNGEYQLKLKIKVGEYQDIVNIPYHKEQTITKDDLTVYIKKGIIFIRKGE